MANKDFVPLQLNDDAVQFTWAGIATGDTCSFVGSMSEYDDRTVQIEGTPSGATLAIQGSCDKTNYQTLNDTFGVALSFTAAGKIRAVTEYVDRIKPVLTGGDGSTSLTVTLICKRKRK